MAAEKDFQLLMLIAKNSERGSFTSSTQKISFSLGYSQQTASRKLRELEKKGLISREASPKGMVLSLTPKGRELLEYVHLQLSSLFEKSPALKKLSGTVESGSGEGAYYTSLPRYSKAFKGLLGEEVFPGTLNMRVKLPELNAFLNSLKPKKIHAFKTKTRGFGSTDCFQVKVNSRIPGLMVFPERSHHPRGVVEIVSPVFLRKRLKLRDGSRVSLNF